ncbi:MAG: hypothetical protein DRI23_02680 [Candidatus Cloacimonadota bacterium]|nr:MAG: hypothetical protein DRI23_02680 [Candidatus Cloacimonadota bacterium]
MRKRIYITAMMLLFLTGIVIAQENGIITFSIDDINIYTINGDGSGLLQLNNHPGSDSGPAWSPTGDKIAFYAQIDSNTWSLHIMDADGSNIDRITFDSNVIDNQPSWTPDGRILFAREYPLQNYATEVWIVNPDGSDLNIIAEDGSYPHCSNDGTKIVYPVYSDGDGEIWIMDIDGANQVKITDNESEEWLPAWSPIADQIVFQSDRDGNHEIYIMNTDGSDVQRLTNNSFYDGYPRWKPDGSKIVFETTRDGNYQIYKMDISGLNQERLTFTNGNTFQPDWKSTITSVINNRIDNEVMINVFPNPFNPTTTISFETSNLHELLQIEIYNLKGQKVKTILINSSTHLPINSVTWNGTDQSNNPVSSGIYYYKLNIPNSPVKKMVLLK